MSFTNFFSTIFYGLKSVFNPSICIGCNEEVVSSRNGVLCSKCTVAISYTNHFQDQDSHDIQKKLFGRFKIDFGAALFYATSGNTGRNIIHNFKYKKKKWVGRWIADRIYERILDTDTFPKVDLVTCVPLHKSKQTERGFNQSAIVAQCLAAKMQLPCFINLMIKIINTESQTTKSRIDRIDNVINSIAISKENMSLIKDKHILLIDDTITTGVTLESCGRILLKNGAKKISVIAMAQAI